MSALTKVFIVLQVVLAILLVAGQIVFVNRTEDFRQHYVASGEQLKQANREIQDLKATDAAVSGQLRAELASKAADLQQAMDAVANLQTQLDTVKTALANSQAGLDRTTASNTFANQALTVALNQNNTLQTQYSDLEKMLSALQKDNSDNTLSIADLRSRLDATQRAREFLAEQNHDLENKLEDLQKLLAANHIQPGQTPTAQSAQPTVPLVGQVSDTRVIDGIPYATINIGSADQVANGTRFSVVDPSSGTFLGFLKVEQVEPHAASGKLDGPHVNDVHQGDEARTQL